MAIIGAGDLGGQALGIASLQNKYTPIGFFDDFNAEKEYRGLNIVGKIDDVENLYNQGEFDSLFVAIGYNHLRYKQKLMARFSAIPFATIVHPTVKIEETADIEPGVLIYANAYIGPNSKIHQGSVINVCSYLPHDNVIRECAFLSCGINLAGKVTIGECSFIGIGVTVSDNISICDDALIGAGAVVVEDITERGIYIGCPARKTKAHDRF